MLRKALISFSLSGLLFLKQSFFYEKLFYKPIHPLDIAALLVAQLLLAFLVFSGWVLCTRARERTLAMGHFLFFLLLFGAWNILFPYLLRSFQLRFSFWTIAMSWGAYLVFSLLFIVGVLWKRSQLFYLCSRGLLVLSPLFAILFFSLALDSFSLFREIKNRPFVTSTSSLSSSPRVFLVLFDEWDKRLTFSERPSTLALPHIDKMASESFRATAAYPAGTDTAYSISSLTTGAAIESIIFSKKNWQLLPKEKANPSFAWDGRGRSIFSDLADKGITCASVGGLLIDYQRLFTPYLSRFSTPHESFCQEVEEEFERLFSLWIPSLKIGVFSQLTKEHLIRSFKREESSLLQFAQDPDVRFCFAHLMGAHHPPIFDRKRGRFYLFHTSFSYYDNVALMDRLIGKLREKLEESHLWDSTTLILTSDHWWRVFLYQQEKLPWDEKETARYLTTIDHRVPLLIKLAGEKRPFTYTGECSNLSLRSLVNELMEGHIRTNEELARFFDDQKEKFPGIVEKWKELKH